MIRYDHTTKDVHIGSTPTGMQGFMSFNRLAALLISSGEVQADFEELKFITVTERGLTITVESKKS